MSSVTNIISELESLNKIYEELLSTAQSKKVAIINNDITELTQLMTRENRLLKQTEHIEELRKESLMALLEEKGIRTKLNLNISEVSRLVFDPKERKDLLEIRDTLVRNTQQLKKENEIIHQLIEQSMQFIDFSLNILVDTEDELIYQNPAQHSSQFKKSNQFFDTKA
ncbi:flagellar protein FlgN [Paenibacillus sp. KQZ6P-2]|uniref:Flagellar protein FlgN n=1 Tax=Paenibacillus mangrovi TaxID=2931978 RepID=A0A9X1WPM3_9BACL|nr:flagellar protein FlgN [Paenibacillus mangrovi]